MAIGEWDQRQLCPDGSCIGVIGPDGTCKVCGRAAPNWGDERNRGLIDLPDEDEEDLASGDEYDDDEDDDEDEYDDEDGAEHGDEASAPAAATASRGDWTVRRLCPDGSCIGLIGPDGHCKVCGRPAADAPAEPSSEPAAEPPTPAAPEAEPPTPEAEPPTPEAEPPTPEAEPPTPAAPAAEPPTPAAPAAEPPTPAAPPAATSSTAEPAARDREPCTTPGCSGHIGADGRCAVCGKGAS